ncbi:hypothetical protein [Nocardia cyriacigeorgica]|uniref:hypothetical protein n=1 Tax=Nocardia cyriacigeorgica TaxID=135487 RepID=UPI0024572640|nr:hypothetical protein [Nocardia cyriacigeorgica]
MSEESKQLSVAELLARNGQQGAASSGGGRRRRAGRGLSVAELTGDLPVIDSGRSAHSAADDDEVPSPGSGDAGGVNGSHGAYGVGTNGSHGVNGSAGVNGYGPASSATQFLAPSYEPPAPHAPESEPVYSPMSGPITRFDPLAGDADTEPRERRRSRHSAPGSDDGTGVETPSPVVAEALGSGRTGRRRRRADPDDEYDAEPQALNGHATDHVRRGWQPAPETQGGRDSSVSGRPARRRAAEAA